MSYIDIPIQQRRLFGTDNIISPAGGVISGRWAVVMYTVEYIDIRDGTVYAICGINENLAGARQIAIDARYRYFGNANRQSFDDRKIAVYDAARKECFDI